MKLFSGSASIELSQSIANKLSLPVSSIDTHIFPDGERRVRIAESVLGQKAVIIQSTNTPVDEHYMELFFLVDGLKRSGAEFVTAIIPYFGYQRQDHVFRDGEAVSLQVIIKILESVGIDRVISIDMHTPRIPDLFKIPVTHLSALPIFSQKIRSLGIQNAVLISPDMGGIGRIKKIASYLDNMPYIALEKNRDLESGALSGDQIREGSLNKAKIGYIVDDMISSGKTIALAASSLKKMGIEKLFVFSTHGIFSEEAPEILQNSLIEKVYITDTVTIPLDRQFKKLEVLSIGEMVAEEIKNSI
jgi:ribose-phosphate pyrophosphokinase